MAVFHKENDDPAGQRRLVSKQLAWSYQENVPWTHAYPCHYAFLLQTGNQQGVAGIWAVLRLERFARRVQRQDDRHMVTLNEGWIRKLFADGTTRAEMSGQNQKTFEVYPKCSGDNLRQLCFFANHLVSCYFIWNPSFSTPGFYQTRSFYIVVEIYLGYRYRAGPSQAALAFLLTQGDVEIMTLGQ